MKKKETLNEIYAEIMDMIKFNEEVKIKSRWAFRLSVVYCLSRKNRSGESVAVFARGKK